MPLAVITPDALIVVAPVIVPPALIPTPVIKPEALIVVAPVIEPETLREPVIVPPLLSNLLSKFVCNPDTSPTRITAALKSELPFVKVVFTKPDVANALLSMCITLLDSGAFNEYPCPFTVVRIYAFLSSFASLI